MEILPEIRVGLFFTADDDFNFNEVTKKMGIEPTNIRRKDSFPVKQFAYAVWILETDKEHCLAVSDQFEKLMKLLKDKQSIIREICNEKNIKVGFQINIFMENGNRPEMLLTKDIIIFLANIGADIGFDLYID